MNWITSLLGIDTAINNRAGEIAEELVSNQLRGSQAPVTAVISPNQRTEGQIEAAILGGSMSGSGIPIDESVALRVSAAHACARLLAQGLAQPSCKVLGADGQEAIDHPLSQLLSVSPNPDQTAYEFREQIGLHLSLGGNAFVRKVKSGGRVVALWPLDPKNVTVVLQPDGSTRYDVVGVGTGLTKDTIWHLKGISWNGYEGENIVRLAREALGLSIAAEAFGSSLFRNGARPAGIVSLNGSPKKDQLDAAALAWNTQYAGVGNANKTAFIGADVAKYTPIASTANEAQWTQARKYQIEEICRAFGVRPSMVYTTGATSYASVEQEFLAHVKFTLAPWHTKFEQSAALALLSPAELKKGFRVKVNTNALLRGSITERMNTYQTMVPLGLMTQNEARALEDLPALTFPGADIPKQAANLFGDPQSPSTTEDSTAPRNNEEQN